MCHNETLSTGAQPGSPTRLPGHWGQLAAEAYILRHCLQLEPPESIGVGGQLELNGDFT